MPQFTEKAIVDSFIHLLNEKPLEKITVKDIVEDCGINRNTFYYHFEDIPALVKTILAADTQRVLEEHSISENWEDGFIAATRFARENKRAVFHIYHSVSREVFDTYLKDIARSVITRVIDQLAQNSSAAPQDKALIASFYTSALVGMVIDWLDADMRYDAEAVIRRAGLLLEGHLADALRHSELAPLWTDTPTR
ncbi:MAG: TetR/AcrR family transcriptional regulator [Eubacteriales bacterium]|nr:TetR/AcrR family transcriptional regulator [Eubacteriales bacterium]